jgi:hypothetical protein
MPLQRSSAISTQSECRLPYQNNPFAFWITQRATGQVIFDSRGHTIIFEDECKLVRLPGLRD